jgi:2-phospho-L-lactate guanylyltransferase
LHLVRKLQQVRALVVPVKSFRRAKVRLSAVLTDDAREQLARDMAASVIAASDGVPVFVVCDDGTVADFAIGEGAFVLWTPRLGLSGAVNAGIDHLRLRGFTLAVVAHADLPFAQSLGAFGEDEVITLAPDRHRDGTNVAAIPTSLGYRFAYGPASFDRHVKEADRFSVPLRVVDDWRLATDIDTPEDLGVMFDLVAGSLEDLRFDLPTRKDVDASTQAVDDQRASKQK